MQRGAQLIKKSVAICGVEILIAEFTKAISIMNWIISFKITFLEHINIAFTISQIVSGLQDFQLNTIDSIPYFALLCYLR
jgi:hypothetical protein